MTVPGSQLSLTQQQAGCAHAGSPWIRNTRQGKVPFLLQLCGTREEESMQLSEDINNSSKSDARCCQIHTFPKACQYPHPYSETVHCRNADQEGQWGGRPSRSARGAEIALLDAH